MHYKTIQKLQAENGLTETQNLINSGAVWRLEGSYGRNAMAELNSGSCMLPKESKRGAYNNYIPSRDEVKVGTVGSFAKCSKYWSDFVEGEI